MPEGPVPTLAPHGQCWPSVHSVGAEGAFEAPPEMYGRLDRTRRSRQECTDARLTTRCQVHIPFGDKVDSIAGSHFFKVSNSCFCVGSGCTCGCAAGIQYLKVCDACCNKCFNQIVSQLQEA
jgi:hypothetical protein